MTKKSEQQQPEAEAPCAPPQSEISDAQLLVTYLVAELVMVSNRLKGVASVLDNLGKVYDSSVASSCRADVQRWHAELDVTTGDAMAGRLLPKAAAAYKALVNEKA